MFPVLLPARLLLTLRLMVFALLLLAFLWSAAFLLACVIPWLKGLPVAGTGLVPRGIACGLVTTLFVVVFHLKREVIRLPAAKRDIFVERVRLHLQELGYALQMETPGRLVFRPSFQSLLFGAGIRIDLAERTATVTGPKVYLEILRRRLRMQSYLSPMERASQLLRRVEMTLRVTPEQLHRVRSDIISILRDDDAEIVCQLIVLARSEAGIRKGAVAEAVQAWQEEYASPVELRTEPITVRPLCANHPHRHALVDAC
jgi:hypothetical protein